MTEEQEFREANKDCFIPEDFAEIHGKYADLPEYLRRWCVRRQELMIKELEISCDGYILDNIGLKIQLSRLEGQLKEVKNE